MNIVVRARGFPLTRALNEHVQQSLVSALGRLAWAVSSVRVTVEHGRRPHGGPDQWCRMRLTGPQLGSVFVEAADRDPYTAVDVAADRAGRRVSYSLERSAARGRANGALPRAAGGGGRRSRG